MLKRVVLALVFVGALGAAGAGLADKAEAHGGCYHGGYGYGGGYRAYYPDYGWYAPRYTYYRGGPHRVHRYRGFPHGHNHRDSGGVYFSIGF